MATEISRDTTAEPKVTYATLSADNDELHARLDSAVVRVRGELGRTLPLLIAGQPRTPSATADSVSPTDTSVVVARAAQGSAQDVNDAVTAAAAAFADWRRTPWAHRCDLLDRAADIIRQERYELTAWLILEMGKNRVEALGEIEETADLYTYYADQMRQNDGYVRNMGKLSPADTNSSVLRPHGVWAVIAPWNFPYALIGAPAAAALVAGNTVVIKPSSDTPLSGYKIADIFLRAGFPAGTINLVMGSGGVVGDGLVRHPSVAGLTFTGSYDVGTQLFRSFGSARYPRPCIVEMGGKNPAIVMASADLDRAALGVFRSAFGMNGHKCSACSRVYLHESIAEAFLTRLDRLVAEARIGDPLERGTFTGPVATRSGFADYQRYVAQAQAVATIRTGGEVLSTDSFGRGYFVRPTVLTNVPRDHALMRDELFVPILCVQRVRDLDEALREANDTQFGLTAGFYSTHPGEIETFLEQIEAGVVYVNRAAGATTGAWPGVQPFGGWKGSGSTGKNIGGHYTVPCYLREQSRTITA
jgi:1-pyrroline-5-carboxylate dehydrogenase